MGGMLDQKYGVYVLPMTYKDSGTAARSLIVCFSANDVDNLTMKTVRTIILSSLWVMIASFVAIYFITEKIVDPLRRMSYATKQFAAGKFDVRIEVDGEDEIAELATAFNSMAQSLAEIEYTRSNFIASVSHDLRTPMTSISGFIDGILDGAIPPEKHTYYLNIIGQEVRRLSRLVSQLLDISRMEAGNRKFEKTPFDICEMARIILLSFESKIDAKRLDVEFNAPDSKLFVYSDKDAINQVIYNICENAVKFSSEGGKYRITISDEGGFVRVSVYNEGVGISPEDLPHIFERFYKSDKSRGLDKTGVGLGLYICSTIMDHLGEKIYVESEHGKYCCFTAEITKYKGKPPISEAD
jgi:signal transduction histidine kinase